MKMLGIDIGAEAIRYAIVRRSFGKDAIIEAGKISLEGNPLKLDGDARHASVNEALLAVVETANHYGVRQACLSLSGYAAQCRVIQLPATLPTRKLYGMLKYEALHFVPSTKDEEYLWDSAVLSSSIHGFRNGLICIARRTDIECYLDFLVRHGLKISRIILDPLSYPHLPAVQQLSKQSPRITACIDAGWKYTTLVTMQDGTVLDIRQIPLGLGLAAQSIAKKSGMEIAAAMGFLRSWLGLAKPLEFEKEAPQPPLALLKDLSLDIDVQIPLTLPSQQPIEIALAEEDMPLQAPEIGEVSLEAWDLRPEDSDDVRPEACGLRPEDSDDVRPEACGLRPEDSDYASPEACGLSLEEEQDQLAVPQAPSLKSQASPLKPQSPSLKPAKTAILEYGVDGKIILNEAEIEIAEEAARKGIASILQQVKLSFSKLRTVVESDKDFKFQIIVAGETGRSSRFRDFVEIYVQADHLLKANLCEGLDNRIHLSETESCDLAVGIALAGLEERPHSINLLPSNRISFWKKHSAAALCAAAMLILSLAPLPAYLSAKEELAKANAELAKAKDGQASRQMNLEKEKQLREKEEGLRRDMRFWRERTTVQLGMIGGARLLDSLNADRVWLSSFRATSPINEYLPPPLHQEKMDGRPDGEKPPEQPAPPPPGMPGMPGPLPMPPPAQAAADTKGNPHEKGIACSAEIEASSYRQIESFTSKVKEQAWSRDLALLTAATGTAGVTVDKVATQPDKIASGKVKAAFSFMLQ